MESRACLPGYKQTEVGVIPEDWSLKKAKDIFIKIQDGTHFSPKLGGADYLYITSKNIRVGKLDLSTTEYIDEKEHRAIYKRCDVRKGDILFTKDGVNTGNAALNNIEKEFSLLSSVAFLRVNEEKDSAEYYLQQILSSPFQQTIQGAMSGNAITRLTLNKINNLVFFVPLKNEQIAIANALSDVDALITSLEKIITKKRAIKTAAMQQLLTGKKRLPPFDLTHTGYKQTELGEIPEDWEVVELGNIGKNITGLTYSPNDVVEYGSLVLRSSNVQNNKLAFENNVFVNMDLPERVIVREGDILVCVRNGSKQLIGKCALIDKKTEGAAFGAFMSIYRTEFSSFIFYQFQSNIIQRQIDEIMGATINQITNKDMSVFKVPLPNNTDEQVAIANLLSDMDKEIDALEHRLNKTQQLKQGMMQELLTGRTRLI